MNLEKPKRLIIWNGGSTCYYECQDTIIGSLWSSWLLRCSLLMLISHLCFCLTNMFCCNFQIAVPVWTHVLPLFCFWCTTGPMITEKHDKHMSETFMWILPNLLYEALCTGIPPLPCIFSNFILMFKAIQSVCSFAIFYLFAIFDGRIPQVVRLGWWSIA